MPSTQESAYLLALLSPLWTLHPTLSLDGYLLDAIEIRIIVHFVPYLQQLQIVEEIVNKRFTLKVVE